MQSKQSKLQNYSDFGYHTLKFEDNPTHKTRSTYAVETTKLQRFWLPRVEIQRQPNQHSQLEQSKQSKLHNHSDFDWQQSEFKDKSSNQIDKLQNHSDFGHPTTLYFRLGQPMQLKLSKPQNYSDFGCHRSKFKNNSSHTVNKLQNYSNVGYHTLKF